MQAAFKTVFLQDFGVLFYFFGLLASFGWCYYGKDWVKDLSLGCPVKGDVGTAAALGETFFWVTFLYSFTWYNCSCCASSVQVKDVPQSYGPVP